MLAVREPGAKPVAVAATLAVTAGLAANPIPRRVALNVVDAPAAS